MPRLSAEARMMLACQGHVAGSSGRSVQEAIGGKVINQDFRVAGDVPISTGRSFRNRAGETLDELSRDVIVDLAKPPKSAPNDPFSLHRDDLNAPGSKLEQRQAEIAETLLSEPISNRILALKEKAFQHQEHALLALAKVLQDVSAHHPNSTFEFQGGVQGLSDGHHVSTKFVIGGQHTIHCCEKTYNCSAIDDPPDKLHRVGLLHTHRAALALECGRRSSGAGLSSVDVKAAKALYDMQGQQQSWKPQYVYTVASIDMSTGMVVSMTGCDRVSVIGCLNDTMTNKVRAGAPWTIDSEEALSSEATRMQRLSDDPLGYRFRASSYDIETLKTYYGNLRLTAEQREINEAHDRLGEDLTQIDGIGTLQEHIFYQSCVTTLKALSKLDPTKVAAHFERIGLRYAPSMEEAAAWIEQAKTRVDDQWEKPEAA